MDTLVADEHTMTGMHGVSVVMYIIAVSCAFPLFTMMLNYLT
jgi:hypothetical protein